MPSFLIGIEPDGLNEQIAGWLDGLGEIGPHDALWVVRRFEGTPTPVAVPIAACTASVGPDSIIVHTLGGRGFDWLGPLIDRLCAWGCDEGATWLRAYGRRGWKRVLERHGVVECEGRDGMMGFVRAI